MATKCRDQYEAIRIVMEKFYNGQERFFEKTLAQSVYEERESWLITVYESTILKEVTMITYMVSKNRKIARHEFWGSAS